MTGIRKLLFLVATMLALGLADQGLRPVTQSAGDRRFWRRQSRAPTGCPAGKCWPVIRTIGANWPEHPEEY